jgi:hypothetical protein
MSKTIHLTFKLVILYSNGHKYKADRMENHYIQLKKLDSNLGIENVLETKKNLMEFVNFHARLWSQKQLPSFN